MRGAKQTAGRELRHSRVARPSLVVVTVAVASAAFIALLSVSGPPERAAGNPSLLEARSILTGTLTLPERLGDTALYEGRALNVFQPGQTLFFLVHLLAAGDQALELWKREIFGVFALSSILFAVALVRLSGGRIVLSISLAASVMFGAPYIASLPPALAGSVHRTNHVLAIMFMSAVLLLLATETPQRKLFLVGACIGGAMLFRVQSILLLIVPVSLLFQEPDGRSWVIRARVGPPLERKALARDLARLLAGPAVAALIVAGFQLARFHNPFETGYIYIYEGRTDYLAERAHHYGLWSLHFLPENLWRTLFAMPSIQFSGPRISNVVGDPLGNSLLFSQPVLLMAIMAWRGAARARVQAFALAALALALPVWTYHNPGLDAPGYMRYSLDYLPMWVATMAVASRHLPQRVSWQLVAALLCVWSIYYGCSLIILGPTMGSVPSSVEIGSFA